MKKLLLVVWMFAVLSPFVAEAQPRADVKGRVVVRESRTPVPMAVVELPRLGLWAVADADGNFLLKGVPAGEQAVAVTCLGFVPLERTVEVPGKGPLLFELTEDNLKLDDVVVTAQESSGAMSTSRTIGGNALEHMQLVNASDVVSLLPGGKTVNPDLFGTREDDNRFSLRSGGSTEGNATFGTAVEVDGVRLSTNASLGDPAGLSTRNIASTNIERVEVVTGVPSAEYGDVSSGVVKISTRKGKTPWTVLLATNPRTKQASLSKGFDLGGDAGVLNASAEYTRATKDPVTPYTSYTRTNLSLNYSNTFAHVWRFSAGLSGNVGGMNSKDDPDAFRGQRTRGHENVLRANASLVWLLNRSWITDVALDGSVNYADNRTDTRLFVSNGTSQPAVHSLGEGYWFATMLPPTYYSDQVIDSRELNYAASLKAKWIRSWNGGASLSNLKAGIAWRAEGNIGRGEYYEVPDLAPTGYRPYSYEEIPYMHNLAYWLEENFTFPVGSTSVSLMAGLRGETTFLKGTDYRNTSTWSPRLNIRWRLSDRITIRGGWGLVEKLPSLGVLYPRPQYTDVRMFDASWSGGNSYVYYTRPYEICYNPDLRWQRNRNAEVGVDMNFGGTRISLAAYFNRTKNPYTTETEYLPAAFNKYGLPEGYAMPANPLLKVDSQTGEMFVRDADRMEEGWVALPLDFVNRTFTRSLVQENGSPVDRCGVELTAEFPTIRPIRTEIRLDAAYGYTKYVQEGHAWYYPSVSSTANPGHSYEYVGIYADNGGSATVTYNGRKSHALDMNLTTTTHIPSIRMIVTLRLEASLVKRSQNLSCYDGREYAYKVDEQGNPTGGSVYDDEGYTAIRPLYYMDTAGAVHPFTDAEAADPAFASLILRSGTVYQYAPDGYDPYFSANLSITKEIGDIASISFYANNFTNSRRYVSSFATGTRVILTPGFYYGVTLRLKF